MPKSELESARPSLGIDAIPEARRDGVHTALSAAFGTWEVGALQPISGGVSGALIFRFDVRERTYVLRIEPERVAPHHRRRGFTCMAAAAAAGVAPTVHYTDPATGVAIMDFVSSRPLCEHPGGAAGMMRALGALVARVQTTPSFPMLGNYPEMIGHMLDTLSRSGLFAAGLLEPHSNGLARIRAVLPWEASSLVSSHNDPNPRNILFDGERLWLVDWELAFRNDPLVDIAILTTELAETPELEKLLLETTFGRTPDRALRARLSVMRLLTRAFYGCIVLENFARVQRSTPDANLAAFTPASFRAAVAEGRLASGAQETAYAFGKMSLTAFIDGLAAPGFDEVLEMVKRG
jgi:Phosphotransferase enzyme family